MFHVSSDESSSSGEEPIGVIVNAKFYEIEDQHIEKLNDYLCSNFDYVLKRWEELTLRDFKLKNENEKKESTDEYLIVDHDKLNPIIITGGKLKNEYFLGQKRTSENNIEEEENRPVKKNNKIGENKYNKSKNNFNRKKFREDIKIENDDQREEGERESTKKLSKNLDGYNGKMKRIQSSKELKKEESLAKKYEHLQKNINNDANPLNPQEDKFSFITAHINAIWEKNKSEYLSNNDINPETLKIFDLFYDFNKKINQQIHCEIYDSLLNLVYIRTERSKEEKKRKKIKQLTDEIRIEYAQKIKNLTLPQIKKMQNYLPEKIWSNGNMSFRLDDIPMRKLPAFILYVDNCTEINSKNKDHINWIEALRQESYANNNHNKEDDNHNEINSNIMSSPMSPVNPLLKDKDSDISDSISSDSSSDSDKSLSDMHPDNNPYNSDFGTNIYLKHTFAQESKKKVIYDEDESDEESDHRKDIDKFNIDSPNIYSIATPTYVNNHIDLENGDDQLKMNNNNIFRKSSSSPVNSIFDINMEY